LTRPGRRSTDRTARATAWRSLCWSRLKDAEKAYQLYLTVLRPSINNGNGTAANWFDMYSQGSYTIFQIDAKLGGPTVALEMLLPAGRDRAAAGPARGLGGPGRGRRHRRQGRLRGRPGLAQRQGDDGDRTQRRRHRDRVRAGTFRKAITLQPGKSVTVRIP
jgi:alpha-L-fucosidase 2